MFGYVIADLARLDEGQQTRYKSFYCGLCRALYRGYGPVPALALTYDMAFLTLFLSALYEPAEQSGASRCLRHPAQAQSWTQTAFTGYAACWPMRTAGTTGTTIKSFPQQPPQGFSAPARSGPPRSIRKRPPPSVPRFRPSRRQRKTARLIPKRPPTRLEN